MKSLFILALSLTLAACGGASDSHDPVFQTGRACFYDPGVLEAGRRYVLEDCSQGQPVWSFRHYDNAGVLRAEVTGGQRPEFVVFSDYKFEVNYCVGASCIVAVRGADGKLIQVK